jgi:hypothetical protein
LARALSDVLHSRAGAFPNAFNGLARALDGLTGTLSDVLYGRASAFADLADRVARAFADLADSLACTRAYVFDRRTRTLTYLTDRMTRAFADFAHRVTRASAHVFHCRTGPRADVFHRGACTGANILYSGAGTGTYVLNGGTRPRAYVLDSRACASADVLDRGVETLAYQIACTSADVFDRRVETLTHQLARAGTYVFHGGVEPFAHQLAGASADVFDRRGEARPLGAEQLACAFTHVFDRRAYAFDEPLDDLRVAVYGGEHPVEDGGHVVEPDLQERLRLDPLYNELDPAEVRINPDRELHEVKHLSVERHLRPQVVELEVDLVHLDDRHVEQHIGYRLVTGGAIRVVQHIVGILLLRYGLVGGDVRRKPVFLRFLDRGPGIVLPYRSVVGDFLRRPVVGPLHLRLLRLIGLISGLLRRSPIPLLRVRLLRLLRLRRLALVLSCHLTSPLFP